MLIAISYEDFGLTPVEAYTFGTPVVALRQGGYLDTTHENVTGVFIDVPGPSELARAVSQVRVREWDSLKIRHHAEKFSEARFIEQIRDVVQGVVAASAGSLDPGPPAF